MAQGPSSELLHCDTNEWYVVPKPYDGSGMKCSVECPGDWLTTVSDGLNWCFEPPATPGQVVDMSKTGLPKLPPVDEVETAAPAVAVDRPSGTPVWVFGLVAVVGVFALAAVMPRD
jgi:hypothetical protein